MHPEPPDGRREGAPDSLVHEDARPTLADRLGHEAEERQLAFPAAPEIELEQPDIAAVRVQRQRLHLRIVENAEQGRVAHGEPAEPEPRLADAAEKLAIAPGLSRQGRQRPPLPLRGGEGRGRAHLEIGHHGRDRAGREVGIAVRAAWSCLHLPPPPGARIAAGRGGIENDGKSLSGLGAGFDKRAPACLRTLHAQPFRDLDRCADRVPPASSAAPATRRLAGPCGPDAGRAERAALQGDRRRS